MRHRTVYVAGPMTGLPMFNWPMFFRAARDLREMGYIVVNPAEQDIINGVNPMKPMDSVGYEGVLKDDFKIIIAKCDMIVLLPGWQDSIGARAECLLSQLIGNDVFEIIWGGEGIDEVSLKHITHDIIQTRVVNEAGVGAAL